MFCKKCGSEMMAGAQFCNKCGYPVDDTLVAANPYVLVAPATTGKRLVNYIVDYITEFLILFIFVILAGLFTGTLATTILILGYVFYFGYYLILESLFGRTLGKVFTKTKVVDRQGNKPSFWRIFGRSLSRYIPFEPFSFLFGAYPMGWHDTISKTLVVSASMTPQEVSRIDLQVIKNQKSHGTAATIAIVCVLGLFFIAFVGILASVVLASLNIARSKGADAAIKANLANAYPKAEIYYDTNNNSYSGVCTNIDGILSERNAISEASLSSAVCNDTAKAWAMSVSLKTNKDIIWCVDSSGFNKEILGGITNQTSCSGDTSVSNSNINNSSVITGAEVCARDIPNATWDGKSYAEDGSYQCDCKAGFHSDSTYSKCVSN